MEWNGHTFVVQVLTSVVLLDNVINVGDRGTNQERKNKGDNVVFVALYGKV